MPYIGPCSALEASKIQESTVGQKDLAFGIFKVTFSPSETQHVLMAVLAKFYGNDEARKLLVRFCSRNTEISLRLLDWLVRKHVSEGTIWPTCLK